ncbi:unnamed protein product, partial [Ectocarpus sp. 8 AP-2014]
ASLPVEQRAPTSFAQEASTRHKATSALLLLQEHRRLICGEIRATHTASTRTTAVRALVCREHGVHQYVDEAGGQPHAWKPHEETFWRCLEGRGRHGRRIHRLDRGHPPRQG